MKIHEHGWILGAQVFVVTGDSPSNTRTLYMPITKIGRKWITAGDGWSAIKFNAETMYLDGGHYTSPGRVYIDEAAYIDSKAVQKAWQDFRSRLPYQAPEFLTESQILDMAQTVFGERPNAGQS